MCLELASFNEVIAIAVGLNFAFILISKATNTNFYELLELRAKDSIERISKMSLKELIQFKIIEDKLKFNDKEQLATNINNATSKIKNEISVLISDEEKNVKRIISLVYHSHASFLLGMYALLILFVAPLKLASINNTLVIFNVLSLLVFITIVLSELILPKWCFKYTLISISILYIIFFVCSRIPLTFILPTKLYKFNFYFTILFPFLSFMVYFFKGLIGTEIIVVLFGYKLTRYDIKNKISAFNYLLDANGVDVRSVDDLGIKPQK